MSYIVRSVQITIPSYLKRRGTAVGKVEASTLTKYSISLFDLLVCRQNFFFLEENKKTERISMGRPALPQGRGSSFIAVQLI